MGTMNQKFAPTLLLLLRGLRLTMRHRNTPTTGISVPDRVTVEGVLAHNSIEYILQDCLFGYPRPPLEGVGDCQDEAAKFRVTRSDGIA